MATTGSNKARVPHHRAVQGVEQRASTRAHIIESAIPVFATRGVDAPVIDDFVRAAEISRGTFYNYFETTRELLEAAMAAVSDELVRVTIPLVEHLRNPVIRFATASRIYHALVLATPHFAQLLVSASTVGVLGYEQIRGDLREAIERGLIGVANLDLAFAIAEGVMVHCIQVPVPPRTASDVRARELVLAILRALGVSPALCRRALAEPIPPLQLHSLRRA